MIDVLEEKGSFTIEATIICVILLCVTMSILRFSIDIYENSKKNRAIEWSQYEIQVSKGICK